jgi:phage shock protein A
MSLFSKARVVVLGNLHDVLNKAIDMNSPSALRQYVRDLETALEELNNEAAVAAGEVRTTEREIADLTAFIETGKGTVQKLQTNGRADLARTKALEVVNKKKDLEGFQTLLTSQRETSTKLDSAVSSVQTKHDQMLSRVNELEVMDGASKAKEHAATALESASHIVGTGADISIDNIESKIRARNDIASEKFDRAMNVTAPAEDPDTTSAVDDLLKECK